MCDTMANIPVEDNPPRVLTEDMFDAAMNQQLSFQGDIESEEDMSSQEENMEVDQDTQGSSQDSSETQAQHNAASVPTGRESPVSVLVIETGLSKQNSNPQQEPNDRPIVDSVDNNGDKDGHNQNSLHADNTGDPKDSVLKKILCNESTPQTVESIDLCDSDSEEFSAEDESSGVETIDNELKSVMENNLMAEIGMTLNKQKPVEPVANKQVESSTPKISVKNIGQIPSDVYNTLPSKVNENISLRPELISSSSKPLGYGKSNDLGSIASITDMPAQAKQDIPTTIHINRIAVPNQTFVNSQGQKMKCVYVKNGQPLPIVINSSQKSNKQTPKYLTMTAQVKKLQPKPASPIVALANMTMKKNMNQKKTVLAKIPTKVLPTAPTFQKPPMLKNVPPRPHQFHLDQNLDSLIKSLLFHNLKKPYKPPQTGPLTPTFCCLDCSDMFLLPTSLDNHLARRSLSIFYWCRICKVQLQFFNRCVFLRHIRGHNCSIKNIDTTCISFSPLTKEVIDSGVATHYFKQHINDLGLPAKDSVLQRSTKHVNPSEELTKNVSEVALCENPTSSSIVNNTSNKKTTSETSQMKCVSFQTKTSVLLNKPISSPAVAKQPPLNLLPVVLSKTSQISAVSQNIHTQARDQSNILNRQAENGVHLLVENSSERYRPLPRPHTQISSSKSNLPETETRHLEDDYAVIDEDTGQIIQNKEEEEEIDIENVTENNTSQCADSLTNKKTKPKEKKTASSSLRRQCGECGAACVNITKHLTGTNRPSNPKLSCDVCKLVLPTKCALKIHLRIHMKLAPYKCPDCGKEFGTWEEVNAHVKFSCGHLAKCIRYLCVSCKSHFATDVNLGNHILSTHSRDIFKCTSCPVAFYSKDSLKKHLSTIHQKELVSGNDYKQCSICPKKLLPTDKFSSHIQEHTRSNNVLIYGYKCPLCYIVFANKMAFIIHQIKEKREIGEKTKRKYDSIADLEGKSDSNSDIEDEPVIVQKYPSPEDSFPSEKDPLSLEGWEHIQGHQVSEKREELCIVCKTNVVVLLPGLSNQSLCCKQCVEPLGIDDFRAQSNGVSRKRNKSMTNGLDKTSKHRKVNNPKAVQRSFSSDDVNTFNRKRKSNDQDFLETDFHNYSLDMTPIKKKSSKKQYKEKAAVDKEHTHIRGQVINTESLNELMCAKCKYIADTRDTFLEHIATHRTDPNTFQCLECGLCFVVLPSLERHLQINHGIKDVNLYTKDNEASMPQKFVSFEDETDDNQCRVCYEMFDSNSSLEKHFRSHGMAFMHSLSKSP